MNELKSENRLEFAIRSAELKHREYQLKYQLFLGVCLSLIVALIIGWLENKILTSIFIPAIANILSVSLIVSWFIDRRFESVRTDLTMAYKKLRGE